jgi:hypothetical protein
MSSMKSNGRACSSLLARLIYLEPEQSSILVTKHLRETISLSLPMLLHSPSRYSTVEIKTRCGNSNHTVMIVETLLSDLDEMVVLVFSLFLHWLNNITSTSGWCTQARSR